jgi:hypothetical protein
LVGAVRMAMVWIVVAVRMGMPCPVGVLMLVLVKDDFQAPIVCLGDPAQGFEAGNVIAALQARDHRFRHPQPQRQLALRFTGLDAESR